MHIKKSTMFKKIISLSLSIIMVFTLLIPSQMNAYAGVTEIKDKATGIVYTTDGVILRYQGKATNLIIPAKLGKTTLKKIYEQAFALKENILISVTLPDTITEIGASAFAGITTLKSIKLPSGLKIIDGDAFASCTSLKDVVIPNGVKTIGMGAFYDCKSLTEINIPQSVTSIEVGEFQDSSITAISIPSGITNIAGAVFANTKLKTVVIPKTVKSIDNVAFYGCQDLTSIEIPKSVKKVSYEAFDKCPLLTIYGENDSAAQRYAAFYNVKFVYPGENQGPTSPIISPDQIVIPPNTKNITVTATPSKTKIAVNNSSKELESYTINGEDYYRITDLSKILAGTGKSFDPAYDEYYDIMQLSASVDSEAISVIKKGDGKEKQATRVYPTIYFGVTEISGLIGVYSVNDEDYYSLSDVMNIIDCGVIKNSKTGVININTKISYEPADSPVFKAVPKGDATYMKTQKALYAAYLGGKGNVSAAGVNIPANTTFYVPRGVTYGGGGNGNVYFGNNSSFVVRGSWSVEYPTRSLRLKSATTKNATYNYGFNPLSKNKENVYMNSNVVNIDSYTSLFGGFPYDNLPIDSAKISYGNVSNGVSKIILNIKRDKLDCEKGLFVYFHAKNGLSYGHLFNNFSEAVDLTPQLAEMIALNVGKEATVDRIDIQSSNGTSYSDAISLPVNWTISTSGTAPSEIKTVTYSDPGYGNSLVFNGLSQKSYISKVTLFNGTMYKIISPDNDYSIIPKEASPGDISIMGEATNIALFTGVKEDSGKDSYTFTVSPFSKDISYASDENEYPNQASVSSENKKTYLNFSLNELVPPESHGSSANIMIKYHKKGDPEEELGTLIVSRSLRIDQNTRSGKLEITLALSDLYNKKGAISIDKFYVYNYAERSIDGYLLPSVKFLILPCDVTPTPIDSVKLGADTKVYITSDSLLYAAISPITGPITATFKISNYVTGYSSLQISPAGKNQWGPNLLKEEFNMYDTLDLSISFDPASPRYDFKVIGDNDNPDTTTGIVRNVSFAGITEAGGKISLEEWGGDTLVGIVTNNNQQIKLETGSFGTDTIDVELFPGADIRTFKVSDFSLAYDDYALTAYTDPSIKITSLSQSTGGSAKLTFTRYFDISRENRPSQGVLVLLYKGYVVGKVTFTNF